MAQDLTSLNIKEIKQNLQDKRFSVVELTEAYLDRIKDFDPKLNSFITVDKDGALLRARELDAITEDLPLKGVPIALKDIFSTIALKTTAATNVLADFIPEYDATTVTRLKNAGAVILGKLNLDAWAHGSSGENSDFGPTKNPWDTTKVAGGSSSGSGASVAARLCAAATGTDTCGSVRLPAAFNNVVGLKPTYGRVSRYGIIAMASSLDSIGHLTQTVWDNAKILETTAGYDKQDATTQDTKVPNYTQSLETVPQIIKGKTIGIPKEYFTDKLNSETKETIFQAIDIYKKLGVKFKEISLKHTDYGLATYYIIQPAEVSSNLGRYDGIRYGHERTQLSPEAKRRIMIGTYTLSSGYHDAYYKKATQVRSLVAQDFTQAFQEVDAVIAPVSPTPAFALGAKQDPLEMYLTDIYAAPSSLAGIPSLAIPAGFSQTGLPIGMQIMGPHFSEELLFQLGHAYQLETDWHTREPRL
jgi:aspartyl-tRNA(Asn)/glutamyl-tRNA(Gln) amidotransferase subunit A